jgi:hypothetical protein
MFADLKTWQLCLIVLAIVGIVVHSLLESMYEPQGYPEGSEDLRWPIGFIGLCMAVLGAKGGWAQTMGLMMILAILVPSAIGGGLKRRKERLYRWSKRPKLLTNAEHQLADNLAEEVDEIIFNSGMPYQFSADATVKGLNEIKDAARAKAQAYYALTGENIEAKIDGFLTKEALKIKLD